MRRPKQYKPKHHMKRIFNFPVYKEIEGKKYHYGGEYPNKNEFRGKIKRLMNTNGYRTHFESTHKGFIVWTRRK